MRIYFNCDALADRIQLSNILTALSFSIQLCWYSFWFCYWLIVCHVRVFSGWLCFLWFLHSRNVCKPFLQQNRTNVAQSGLIKWKGYNHSHRFKFVLNFFKPLIQWWKITVIPFIIPFPAKNCWHFKWN